MPYSIAPPRMPGTIPRFPQMPEQIPPQYGPPEVPPMIPGGVSAGFGPGTPMAPQMPAMGPGGRLPTTGFQPGLGQSPRPGPGMFGHYPIQYGTPGLPPAMYDPAIMGGGRGFPGEPSAGQLGAGLMGRKIADPRFHPGPRWRQFRGGGRAFGEDAIAPNPYMRRILMQRLQEMLLQGQPVGLF